MDNKNSRDATKAASFYSTFATLLINLLICIVFVELVARIYTGRPDQQQDVRTQLPYYANQAWSDQYWQEFGSIDRSYQPHTIWRRNEFRGRYINVGKDGLRATPQSDCASAEKTVFMFGGSAMWGEGAPDTRLYRVICCRRSNGTSKAVPVLLILLNPPGHPRKALLP